jgi:hypothetical protein
MKPPRWACFEALVALALLLHIPASGAQQAVQQLDQAEFVLDDGARPPTDAAPWQAVTLPDRWPDSRPNQWGIGWYRLPWLLDKVPAQAPGLFLPKAGHESEVYVNGRLVGHTGTPERPDLHARPHLYVVDPTLLRPGRNTIHVRMHAQPLFAGVLDAPEVGDATTLTCTTASEAS